MRLSITTVLISILVDPLAHPVGEFAGRQLRGVNLLDEKLAAALHFLEIDAETLHAREQQPEFFVEHEQRRLFAALDRGDDEHDRGERFAGAGGTENERARSGLDPAAQQPVQLDDAARHRVAFEVAAIFRRHQPRKHVETAGGDGDIVIAAAKLHAAIFDDAGAPPLRAVGRRQFLQPQHAMRDAVHGLVGDIGGQVVEQHHGGVELGEVMLDRENLPPVAQRALRQQPDFGQAVQHHPVRLRAVDDLEDLLGGFAEFEVGGIQQALLLLRIQQAFRRQQFEDLDAVVERPAMGSRAVAQLALGLRQGDVEALFARLGAFEQELQRYGGLAGAGRAFHQKDVATRKSARQNIVEPPNA